MMEGQCYAGSIHVHVLYQKAVKAVSRFIIFSYRSFPFCSFYILRFSICFFIYFIFFRQVRTCVVRITHPARVTIDSSKIE